MRALFVWILPLFLILSPPDRVEAGPEVDLADLADLSMINLDSLRDLHHQLAIAEIQAEGAKAMVNRTKESLQTAEKDREAKQADVKAAKAELDAAKKNSDAARTRAAENLVKDTQARLATANALKEWRDQQGKLLKAEADLAKMNIDLSKARLQLARVSLVIESGLKTERPYRVSEFRGEVTKVEKDMVKAQKKIDQELEKNHQAEARWTRYSLESN